MEINAFKKRFTEITLSQKQTTIKELIRAMAEEVPPHLVSEMEDLIRWCNAVAYSPSIDGVAPEDYLK